VGRIENRLVDLDGAVIEASGNRLERRFQQCPRFIVVWQIDPIKKVVSVPAVGNDRFGPAERGQAGSDIRYKLLCRLLLFVCG
jgi:hypothetical protein